MVEVDRVRGRGVKGWVVGVRVVELPAEDHSQWNCTLHLIHLEGGGGE